MLHKKKRWTAAIHATGQPPVPVLLPTATSPNSQWISHPSSSSPGVRPQPRLPTPPVSNPVNNQIPSGYNHLGDNVPPVSVPSHLNSARPTLPETYQLGSKPQTSSNRSVGSNELSGLSAAPLNRNDLSSNLIAAITNSPELLQQSGLLLQILPQEYIEKYTKSLEKRNNTSKHIYESGSTHSSLIVPGSDLSARAGTNEAPGSQISPTSRVSQPSNRPNSTDFSPIFRTTSPSNMIYQAPSARSIDANRVTPRSTLGPRLSSPQAPSYSCSTASSTQQQSPHRRISGSTEGIAGKGGWGASMQHPATQQPQIPSLDYSTISAVARAASLLHSSSRMNSAAALLSQWDPATQLALLSQAREGNNRTDGFDQKQSVTSYPAVSPVSSSLGGYHPPSTSISNPLVNRVFGSQQDLPKHRNQAEVPSGRVHTPSNQTPISDPRRQSSKPANPQSRQTDPRLLPAGPGSLENLKSFRDTPPWLSTDGRSEQNIHINPAGVEAADARLSILQDAKLAALSVEWPASNNACPNSTASKTQRSRCSTSFSSPGIPGTGAVPMAIPPNISQTTSLHPFSPRCTLVDAKEIKRVSPNLVATDISSFPRTKPITISPNQVELSNTLKPPTPGSSSGTSQARHKLTPSPSTLALSTGATVNENSNRHQGTSNPTRPNGDKSPRPNLLPGISVNVFQKMMNSPTADPVYSGTGGEASFPWPPPKAQESQPRRISTPSEIATPNTQSTAPDEDEAHKAIRIQTESRSTAMPLKKRLMQRYEADNGTNAVNSASNLSTTPAVSPDLTRLLPSGPKLSPHSPLRSDTSFTSGMDQRPLGPHDLSHSANKSHERLKSEQPENLPKKRKTNRGRNFSDVSDGSLERKPSARRVPPGTKHAGRPKDSRKNEGGRTRRSTSRNRQPKGSKIKAGAIKCEEVGSISEQKTRKQAQRRTRRPSSSTSSARSSSRLDDGEELPRRRMAAVNGTYLMMVASRAHRSRSSASSASSSSLRSVEAGVDSDFDHNTDNASKSSKSYPRTKTEKLNHTYGSTDSESKQERSTTLAAQHDRVRKPKRAAALAASAATAASATFGMKRPRLSSTHIDLQQHANQPPGADREDEELDADDDSMSTDGASSIMTLDPKGPTTSSILDELSAALVEDKLPYDELTHQIPGPPDLQQLTNHSLRPIHSLDHYRRSRTPFVQLVSCNDPGLKQIPKCRACRQLKRTHVDDSTNLMMNGGVESGLSDEEGRLGTVSATGVNGTAQFKRPSGRNGQTEKATTKESLADYDRLKNGDKQRGKKTAASSPVSVFCRFWGFRKLIFNNRGILKIAGFCHSNEATSIDRSLWEMYYPVSPCVDSVNAKYLLERAGVLFCRLLRQEVAILTGNSDREPVVHRGPGAPPKNGLRRGSGTMNASLNSATTRGHPSNVVAWKRPVKGVREMCDVCETTMFNTHWVCAKCGYSVCVHCCEEARLRKSQPKPEPDGESQEVPPTREKSKGKQTRARAGPPGWASCTTTRQHHDPDRLVLTSLLPASTIGKLLHRVHRISRHYQIRMGCDCLSSPSDVVQPKTAEAVLPTNENSLDLLADLALKTDSKPPKGMENVERQENGLYGLKRDISSPPGSHSIDPTSLPPHTWIRKPEPTLSKQHGVENNMNTVPDPSSQEQTKYCVLQLHNAESSQAFIAFQHEWRANRPVVISGCQAKFNSSLWTPRSFADEFGPLRTTLVDCATGIELTRYPLRTFWDGFERKTRRLVSKDGRALCLKLKDWPTTDDFAELQPHRFNDLMSNLPMPEYTRRDGQLNLASRLNSFFVCPDLGPKLYVAYGTGGSRSIGTTNLHVDIADAINILLYVGHPSDSVEESNANAEAVLNVMRQANVDPVYLERAVNWSKQTQCSNGSHWTSNNPATPSIMDAGPPGALWHIFLPKDMPALREFLTQITEEETGAPLEPGSDPIHDQLFYLDQPLLDRLYASTGVLPCTLIQFTGDAIFIPAGAAHQVRNLNSCIKAAVDFVSPEHLPQCFQLIEQFRRLSATHQNHEDKLQVKNMLFHAVKDALSVLLVAGDDQRAAVTEKTDQNIADQSLMKQLGQLFEPNQTKTVMNASLLREEETNEFNKQYSRTRLIPTNSPTRRRLTSPTGSSRGRPGRPKSSLFSSPGKISPSCKSSSPDSDSFRTSKVDGHNLVYPHPTDSNSMLFSQSSPCTSTQSITSCNRSPVIENSRANQISTDEGLQT